MKRNYYISRNNCEYEGTTWGVYRKNAFIFHVVIKDGMTRGGAARLCQKLNARDARR